MTDIDGFLELARTRRTVRGYQQKEVPGEYIDKILEAARWAPSGANSQPWEFVVITDPEMRRRIVDLFIKAAETTREIENAARPNATHAIGSTGFQHAPVFILVLGDRRVNQSFPVQTQHEKGEQHFITGLASATLMIHLAATTLGLGAQWVSAAGSPYMSTLIKSWLGIPQHLKVYDMVTIGYPTKQPQPPPRRPLEEIVHRETYSQERERTEADIQRFLMQQTRLGRFGLASAAQQRAGDSS